MFSCNALLMETFKQRYSSCIASERRVISFKYCPLNLEQMNVVMIPDLSDILCLDILFQSHRRRLLSLTMFTKLIQEKLFMVEGSESSAVLDYKHRFLLKQSVK
jgi:hypothetical protein